MQYSLTQRRLRRDLVRRELQWFQYIVSSAASAATDSQPKRLQWMSPPFSD